MESYEIVSIFPKHPWYLAPQDGVYHAVMGSEAGAHFFKGDQVAVVENIDDWEGDGPYMQPVAMFFGSEAYSRAKAFCFTLNFKESE
jgi:hypothetical protein